MAIPVSVEELTYGGSTPARLRGVSRAVISGVGATRTLLAKESGALCLYDSATGVVYTLPVPTVGMWFEFLTTVTITSNAAKVITNSASVFLVGGALLYIAAAATTFGATANGTTHRAVSSNGTTTGGVIGDRYVVTAISATQWTVAGVISGSGALATPMATS